MNPTDDELRRMVMTLLVTYQPRIKEHLADDLVLRDKLLKEEPTEFHDVIRKQFAEKANKVMVDLVTKQLACGSEIPLEVLSHLMLDDYLTA